MFCVCRVAFPQIQHQRVERDDGTLEMQLLGVMRRPTPHAFPPPPKRGAHFLFAFLPMCQIVSDVSERKDPAYK